MDSGLIKIYSSEDLPRLNYIAGIVFGDILGLQWEVTTDKRRFGKHPVINYSDEMLAGSFKISPVGILSEEGIKSREINVGEWKSLPIFFYCKPDCDLPFDIFGAAFYLITRYEEYLENKPDDHSRYKASSSLAFKNGFLSKPVVDLWAKELSKLLIRKFPTLTFRRNEFRALLTIDVDQPFAYKGKGLMRSIGGLFKDLGRSDGEAGERFRTISKGESDPYDVFDYISEKIEENKTESRFFFPVGDRSKYDVNPSWKNNEYRQLIEVTAGKYPTGLHPSYYAANDGSVLSMESKRFATIHKNGIKSSRFHYIRLFMPESYRNLSASGIVEDYSMGYPEEPGFRAGIARPFYFFDLTANRQTNLKVFPFQVMDATLIQYKKLDTDQAAEIINGLLAETKKAGGLFLTIWHNTTLLDDEDGREWRKIFEKLLQNQRQ
jgi:hypothetical protein